MLKNLSMTFLGVMIATSGLMAQKKPNQPSSRKITLELESDTQTQSITKEQGEFELKLVAKAYKQVWEKQKVESNYWRPDCEVRREFWPAEWQGYERLSNEKKARLLSDLIQIPYSATFIMVEAGYFRSRPWTWTEFDDQLYRADRYWYYLTVVQGEKSRALAERLGYISTDCTWTLVTFVETVELPLPRQRHEAGDAEREIRVRVQGTDFLANESDTLRASFDGDTVYVSVVNGIHIYNKPERTAEDEWTVAAATRRLLTNDWQTAKLNFEKSGTTLLLRFEDLYFDALRPSSPQYELTLNIKIFRAKFWGTNPVIFESSIKMTGGEYELDLAKYIAKGETYYADVSFSRRKTKYFDTRESETIRTNREKSR